MDEAFQQVAEAEEKERSIYHAVGESNAPRETASFVALRIIACAVVVVLCCLLATFSFAMQSERPRDV